MLPELCRHCWIAPLRSMCTTPVPTLSRCARQDFKRFIISLKDNVMIQSRIERTAPYFLYGDNAGKLLETRFSPG
jgi:hypothetical protein